jgi:excisionase family DNA binding protein
MGSGEHFGGCLTVKGWGKVKTACRYVDVSERTFRKWLTQGLRHSRLPSGTVLVRYSDIDEFLESFSVNNEKVEKIVTAVCEEFLQ